MDNVFSTGALINELKKNPFILNSSMPMGYVPGLPVLCSLNDNLCMKVPFLKYKVTGKVDNTLVYPIRYVATVLIPEGTAVSFDDLSLISPFAKVDFSKPVGRFRHEAIKNLKKEEYRKLRSAVYAGYDKIIGMLTKGTPYTFDDEMIFKKMLNTIIEPSLRPFYKVIDSDFYKKFLS